MMYSKEESKNLGKEFWVVFARRCEIVPELKYRKKKWMLYDTGLKGIDLKFDITPKSVSVVLEINVKNEIRRNEIFETLSKYQSLIEEGFENLLIWDKSFARESGQEVCRIYKVLEGYTYFNQLHWPEIYNFMIDNMLILERNFLEIKDLLELEHY